MKAPQKGMIFFSMDIDAVWGRTISRYGSSKKGYFAPCEVLLLSVRSSPLKELFHKNFLSIRGIDLCRALRGFDEVSLVAQTI